MGYLTFFFNLPNLSWMGVLTLYLLTLMRIVPIVALAPFLGTKATPIMGRVVLALSLSVIFLPILVTKASHSVEFDTNFIGYSIKELFIGFIMGFIISFPFYIVQSSGIIIDYLRGASIMQSQDPTMQNQSSPIGVFYNYIFIILFFQIDGPFLFFDALVKSYDLIPADSFVNPLFFQLANPFWQTAVDIINQVATISIQLAAPALIAILMGEMFLGIANRLAPQVQIAFLGMSIKSLLGLALVWAGWFFLLKQFASHSYSWLKLLDSMINQFKFLKT
ncbi:MAG: flagellar biosynthetic protein FliR [Simkania negevensis]|nr:flagellar biosynthetic protein FliR [Simkania negevensis]